MSLVLPENLEAAVFRVAEQKRVDVAGRLFFGNELLDADSVNHVVIADGVQLWSVEIVTAVESVERFGVCAQQLALGIGVEQVEPRQIGPTFREEVGKLLDDIDGDRLPRQSLAVEAELGGPDWFGTVSVLREQGAIGREMAADDFCVRIRVEIVHVLILLESILEKDFLRIGGGADDGDVGIGGFNAFVHGLVGGDHLPGLGFVSRVRFVAQVHRNRQFVLVLIHQILRAFAERGCVIRLIILAMPFNDVAGSAQQGPHPEFLAVFDAGGGWGVGWFRAPGTPDTADADAQPVGQEEVFLDSVIPIARGERDVEGLVLLCDRFRQDRE